MTTLPTLLTNQAKIEQGKREAAGVILKDVDFTYRLIDHVTSIEEDLEAKPVPRDVIYLFQTLLHSTEQHQANHVFVQSLSLLVHSIVDRRDPSPRFENISRELKDVGREVRLQIVKENRRRNRSKEAKKGAISSREFRTHFDTFVDKVKVLVKSESFQAFAQDALPEIKLETHTHRLAEHRSLTSLILRDAKAPRDPANLRHQTTLLTLRERLTGDSNWARQKPSSFEQDVVARRGERGAVQILSGAIDGAVAAYAGRQ